MSNLTWQPTRSSSAKCRRPEIWQKACQAEGVIRRPASQALRRQKPPPLPRSSPRRRAFPQVTCWCSSGSSTCWSARGFQHSRLPEKKPDISCSDDAVAVGLNSGVDSKTGEMIATSKKEGGRGGRKRPSQGFAHRISNPTVGGSNPSRRAILSSCTRKSYDTALFGLLAPSRFLI